MGILDAIGSTLLIIGRNSEQVVCIRDSIFCIKVQLENINGSKTEKCKFVLGSDLPFQLDLAIIIVRENWDIDELKEPVIV